MLAAPAGAAGWHRVTPAGGDSIDEVGVARSANGVLHLAWVQADAADPSLLQDIATRTMSANGKVLGPVALIASGWSALSNPALLSVPGGLRAFFGGLRSTNPEEPNLDLSTAFSADGGTTWTLQIGDISKTPGAYASNTAATLPPSGVPMIAGGGTGFGPYVTTGLAPGAPVFDPQLQLGDTYGYDPNLVTDATGTPYVAWASGTDNAAGIWAQQLTPAGGPAAPPLRMPGVVGKGGFVPELQRTPLAARAGGGVYVASPGGYPSTTKVQLWKVGAPQSRTIAQGAGDHLATVTATADGRLWIVWSGEDDRIEAVRTDKTATKLGATVSVAPPHGTHDIYQLDASAVPAGAVDVSRSPTRAPTRPGSGDCCRV